MANNDLDDTELAVFFEDAKAAQLVELPVGLTERVLADAAEIGAGFVVPDAVVSANNTSFLNRIFAPIGGLAGAVALGAFASIGLFVGLGDPETLYALPVMGDILAVFLDEIGGGTPLDTLEYLMAES